MAKIDASVAILQVLRSGGPGYGLELIERCAKNSRGHVVLSQGATYTAIGVLLAGGYVRTWLEGNPRPVRGGRPRRYYELTAKGHKKAHADRVMTARLFDMEVPPPGTDN